MLQGELCAQHIFRGRIVAENNRVPVGANDDLIDIGGRGALLAQGQCGVDGGVGVPAGGPRLDADVMDRPGGLSVNINDAPRIGVAARRGEKALRPLQNGPEADKPVFRELRRRQPRMGRARRMELLGEGPGLMAHLPETARLRAREAEGPDRFLRIKIENRGGRRRGAERSAGAGVVPVPVMVRSDGAPDADDRLVTAHDAVKKRRRVGLGQFRRRQRSGNNHRPRMKQRAFVHVVHLKHVAEGAGVENGLETALVPDGGAHGPARRARRARDRAPGPIEDAHRRPVAVSGRHGRRETVRKTFGHRGAIWTLSGHLNCVA